MYDRFQLIYRVGLRAFGASLLPILIVLQSIVMTIFSLRDALRQRKETLCSSRYMVSVQVVYICIVFC